MFINGLIISVNKIAEQMKNAAFTLRSVWKSHLSRQKTQANVSSPAAASTLVLLRRP